METQKCARSSRLQVGDMTHLGRAHRLNCTSLGRACVVITGKVGRKHNEWALIFDKGLRYLETKGLVSSLCALTEPVRSSLAKWGTQHNEWALTFDKGLRYLGTKGLVSGLCASTERVGSLLATDANPFASCSMKTKLFIFSEWSIGHSEKIKKFIFGGNTEMR